MAENLFYDYSKLSEVDQEVHTYIGSVNKTFKQMAATISFGHKLVTVPFLVDDDLNISFEIPSMNIFRLQHVIFNIAPFDPMSVFVE